MGIENVKSTNVLADPHRMGGTVAPAPRRRSEKKISADEKKKLHARLINWFYQERDKQAENRYQMAIDEDFYDGLQWSDEDAQELANRGQAPLVFNLCKPTINWLLGTERRTRVDGKVLPREESDEEGAQVKNKLLKYLSDVNRTPFSRSQAFKHSVVAGLGWMENSIARDPGRELLSNRNVDWKRMYHDSTSTDMDMDDGRYVFRWSWVDLDVAEALCPDQKDALRQAAIEDNQIGIDEDDVWYLGQRVNASTGDYASVTRRGMSGGLVNNGRERVKLIECWYKDPVSCKVCRSHDPETDHLDGADYNPQDPEILRYVEDGYLSVTQHVKMEMRVAIMTESVILYAGKSPYKHNRFPFVPLWCYRRARDGMPYGVIRDIRDAQIDYNKRASKALYILSTVRVVMDENAVDDVDQLRREVARPDAIIVKKRNAELRIEQDKQLAEEHIRLMQFDGQMIRDVGGVTDQNLGKDDKGLSGQAIGKLQDQGSIVTAVLFDNYRLAVQLESELQLSLIEQFYTAPKVVRIVGENKPIEWLKLNQWDETEGKYLNDITKSQADFIVSEQDFKASIRQAMFEAMMDLVAKLPPEIGMSLLDMVIDFADVPNKEELVARIRKINGQADPTRKPTPEEEQAQAERDAKAQAAEQIQFETQQAVLDKTRAEVEKILSDVQRQAAETQRAVAAGVEMGVKAAYEALQAAQIVATVPGATPVADAILAGAGHKDQGGEDPNIPAPDMGAPIDMAQPPVDPAMMEPPELQQTDGAAAGIETLANDGVIPPGE